MSAAFQSRINQVLRITYTLASGTVVERYVGFR